MQHMFSCEQQDCKTATLKNHPKVWDYYLKSLPYTEVWVSLSEFCDIYREIYLSINALCQWWKRTSTHTHWEANKWKLSESVVFGGSFVVTLTLLTELKTPSYQVVWCKAISLTASRFLNRNTNEYLKTGRTHKNPNTKTSWNWRKADTTDGKKKSAASDGAFSTHKY